MKRFIAFAISTYFVGVGLLLAQIRVYPPGFQPTKTISNSQIQENGTINTESLGGHTSTTNMQSFNIQLLQEMRQVRKDVKMGKLTKAQAKSAMANLAAIRKQELEFFHQNGRRDITPDQKSQLTSELEKNQGSI
jgi:hypothetical protein